MPKRIQLRRSKGWRMPENAVKVDRSTKWGNPFTVGKHGTAAECLQLYKALWLPRCKIVPGANMLLLCWCDEREWGHSFLELPYRIPISIDELRATVAWMHQHIHQLRGHDLACWCPIGQACHADVLLELANAREAE